MKRTIFFTWLKSKLIKHCRWYLIKTSNDGYLVQIIIPFFTRRGAIKFSNKYLSGKADPMPHKEIKPVFTLPLLKTAK